MQLEILPAVYPKSITVTYPLVVTVGSKQYEAIVDAIYSAPDEAYDQQEVFRDKIELVELERAARTDLGEFTDHLIKDVLRDAEQWTPTKLNITPTYLKKMKTVLPNGIGTVEQAIKFLTELHKNGESFHPEDDATDLHGDPFTQAEGESLNALMLDIYKLPGNEDTTKMDFDPCEYLLLLDRADHVITIDGDPTTIGEYMRENDWECISDHIGEIAYLEPGDEYVLATHSDSVVIKKV